MDLNNDGLQILPGKWVYDLKSDSEDTIVEFHARWVVCGNFQAKSGDATWSLVANDISVKIFLTYCAREDLIIYQADIIGAYLHALLQYRRVLVAQPTSIKKEKNSVCLLRKALYGLRESANL